MDVVRLIILCGHFVGLALLLGGFLIQLGGERRVIAPMMRGAELQVITGILLVAAREIEHLADNHAKVAVKLVIALAVVACAAIGRRRPQVPALFYATGILTLVNVAVAVFWR